MKVQGVRACLRCGKPINVLTVTPVWDPLDTSLGGEQVGRYLYPCNECAPIIEAEVMRDVEQAREKARDREGKR